VVSFGLVNKESKDVKNGDESFKNKTKKLLKEKSEMILKKIDKEREQLKKIIPGRKEKSEAPTITGLKKGDGFGSEDSSSPKSRFSRLRMKKVEGDEGP